MHHPRRNPLDNTDRIKIELVTAWDEEQIVELYRAGGWWKEYMDPTRIPELIRGSFLFAVAIDTNTTKAVGMGRVISDGIADAYLQDLVVLLEWRNKGVGEKIISALVECCRFRGIMWIGLIAEPGTDSFYRPLGFTPMEGHVPMLFHEGGYHVARL
jgi:GNAT superfamily N-acetyltransferase